MIIIGKQSKSLFCWWLHQQVICSFKCDCTLYTYAMISPIFLANTFLRQISNVILTFLTELWIVKYQNLFVYLKISNRIVNLQISKWICGVASIMIFCQQTLAILHTAFKHFTSHFFNCYLPFFATLLSNISHFFTSFRASSLNTPQRVFSEPPFSPSIKHEHRPSQHPLFFQKRIFSSSLWHLLPIWSSHDLTLRKLI